MRLTMTVLDTHGVPPTPRHVTIEAGSGTRFGEVRARLADIAGVPGCRFTTAGRLVGDEDLVGAPPLLRGALLMVARSEQLVTAPPGRGVVELRVVSGVGAGRVIALGRGEHVLGRAASADVRLDDPGVSRAHAVVAVAADGVTVRDVHPTNGSCIDGSRLAVEGARLVAGQSLTVGSTTLVLGSPGVRSGHHSVVDGEVRIHRPPRLRDGGDPPPVTFPETPERPARHRVPLLASFAPVVLSAVLALALSSPTLLLFALMSPVLLLGQWWSDRRAGRVSYRRRTREHADRLVRATRELDMAVTEDTRRRGELQPDLGHLEAVVRRRGARLWERRPTDEDHLVLRLGTATQPSGVEIVGPAPDHQPKVAGLPALVDLARTGIVGVAGRRDHALSLVGALVLQLATWHTPRHVRLQVLSDTARHARDWEWAAHLPHAREQDGAAARIAGDAAEVALHVAALNRLVESRLAAADSRWSGSHDPPPDLVVVLDGASALRALPGAADLLRDGPRAGIAFVCLDLDVTSLPAETRTSVHVFGAGLEATIREDGRALTGVVPDLPSLGWLDTVARAMSPFVDATPEGGEAALPRDVSFVELHRAAGTDVTTAEGLTRAWSSGAGRAAALLGRTADGPLAVDLAAQGPHVLVGGTTGSGKSELLQALVTGLAVTNRPDELGLLLVDYKGGSAFRECARLPHTVGLVTDLDARLTARALISLDAEMKRRERLLARAGARNLDDYRKAAGVCRELPGLARLVIVVDEFKALADEFPDFINGLVRVAALGRSLGLHLVLATQRPAGIVSADMRANLALRIALRVRDRADSEDVVDSAAAATLDPRTPGRACLRSGDLGLTTVQTAYLGRPVPDASPGDEGIRVVVRDLLRPVAPRQPGLDDDDPGGRTELHLVVDAANAAADRGAVASSRTPWLPPLPDVLTESDAIAATFDSADRTATDGVALGLVDVPDEQRRETFWWRPDDGHLGIAGGPRSGRSTALVALALGLAGRASAEGLHVHVLQGAPGPCAALAPLPHVGTVTDSGDPARSRRLVARLLQLVDGDEAGPRRTLVLVDGWESLEESLSGLDHGAPVDDLHRLLRDGPAAGVTLAITGGRALLSGRLPGLLDRRLALHLPDPLDLTLAGVPPPLAAVARPPGRAVDLATGRELQLVVPGSVDDAVVRFAGDTAGVPGLKGAPGVPSVPGAPGAPRGPWRIAALPERVELDRLPSRGALVWLGIGGDDAAPVALPLAVGRRRVLVAGPHRSGRSSTLATIGDQLISHGRHVAVLSPRRSALSTWAGARGCLLLDLHDASVLVRARQDDPDLCLLVDDVESVDASPAETPLLEAARLVDGTDGLVVVAAELQRANGAFRGLVPEVARDGVGILLGATSPGDGDVVGVRLEPAGARRPGRGHLVTEGQAAPIQIAHLHAPTPDASSPHVLPLS